MKGATPAFQNAHCGVGVSIHAPNEGSDRMAYVRLLVCAVSIHAPNEGSDNCMDVNGMILLVSIHAPNEGSDLVQ